MADVKISGLDALTAAAAGDLLPLVDVSDTSMAPTGTTKRLTVGSLVPGITVTPSGDTSGAADTAAVQAVLNTGPVLVTLAPGDFYFSTPLAMSTARQQLQGSGYATVCYFAAGFTGTALITVTADRCTVRDLLIRGISTTISSNPAGNGIQISSAQHTTVRDVLFQYVNGWGVQSLPAGATPNLDTMLDGVTGRNCAGGVHVKSTSAAGWQGQHFLANMQFQQIGSASNLDVFRFEDVYDVVGVNFNCGISNASTGSAMHLVGNCATIYLANLDLGCYPNSAAGTNDVWLIEDGANGHPVDVRVAGAVGQQGRYGLRVTGAAARLHFTAFRAFNNYHHGVSVEGTGSEIVFTDLACFQNGQAASGTNYDVNWAGTAAGAVTGAALSTAVVAALSAGVQNPGNFNSASNVYAESWNCTGTGTTSANVFPSGSAAPAYVRRVVPWNPRGTTTVAVPASGSPVSARASDAFFYVTAGASSCTMTVSGGPAIVIPAAALGTVFVPAGQTVTPTYTNAPTWVVYGN